MRLPVSPLGWVTLVGAALGGGVGWWLGWVEFLALGIGCLLAVIVAIPFVVGSHHLELNRTLEPDRVSVGDDAASVLTINNSGRRTSSPRVVSDVIGGVPRLIDVPALSAGAPMRHRSVLPTGSRGVIDIGPADITKGDPIGLLRRTFGGTGISKLWVHPRYVALAPLQSGFVKDLEGPTFDTSPAGDVAFHAIREYVPGDDVRHIHWMSTARTGSLMIRHYVDNRRPYLGVLVDNRSGSMSGTEFEIALEVAASHVVSAAIDSRPVAVWVGDQQVVSEAAPADRNTALDRLCVSGQSAEGRAIVDVVETMRQVDNGISAVVLITGGLSPSALLPTVTRVTRHSDVVVARCSSDALDSASLPLARLIDFNDVSEFAARWRSLAR